MENKPTPEAIKVIKNLCKTLLVINMWLTDVVYASNDDFAVDKLERSNNDIEQQCKHYPWLLN